MFETSVAMNTSVTSAGAGSLGSLPEPLVEVVAEAGVLAGQPLHEVERLVILETLKQQSFNRTKTAKVLQIGIRTLQRKLKQYGTTPMNGDLQLIS